MTEQTIESNSRAFLSLGEHGLTGISELQRLQDRMSNYLSSSNGKIIYVQEALGCPEPVSSQIAELTSQGVLPSKAYAQVLGISENNPITDYESLQLSEDEVFSYEERGMIDAIAKNYPGRFTVVLESTPNSREEEREAETSDRLEEVYKDRVLNGEFAQAIVPFKLRAYQVGIIGRKREERIADIVGDIMKQNEELMIAIRFGTTHTGIGRLLRQRGYNVAQQIETKEDNIFKYDPFSIAIRAIMMGKERNITPLMWQRLTVGSIINHVVDILHRITDEKVDVNFVNQVTLDILKTQLVSRKQLSAFQQHVKEDGFHKALATLLNS